VNRSDKAVERFGEGFNCAQAVVSVYASDLGLDEKKSFKVACAFGGGMARCGLTCGAVTGALMVLGLRHGMDSKETETAKEKTYERTVEFMEAFKVLNGSLACKELLGCDLSEPAGKKRAKEKGLFKTICPKMVRDAVDILEKMA